MFPLANPSPRENTTGLVPLEDFRPLLAGTPPLLGPGVLSLAAWTALAWALRSPGRGRTPAIIGFALAFRVIAF